MILWLACGSIFGVWNVFQSSGLDFRLIALGAVLPLAIDAPFGGQSYAHTLLSGVSLLTVAMLATIGRGNRLRRRRALSFVIGWFAGLVLERRVDAQGSVLVAGVRFRTPGRAAAPAAGPSSSCSSCSGIAAAAWIWVRFGLADRARRAVDARAPGRLRVVGESMDVRRMIAFVRHGQTAANRDGRFQGRIDPPLTDARPRASRARRRAVRDDAGHARRREPADAAPSRPREPIAAAHGLAIDTDERLVELDYGEWDERGLRDITPDEWARWRADHVVRAARRRVTRPRRRARRRRSAPSTSATSSSSP